MMTIDQTVELSTQLLKLISDFSMQEATDRAEVVQTLKELIGLEANCDVESAIACCTPEDNVHGHKF